MNKADLLKKALANVIKITNDKEFKSEYGEEVQRFYYKYKKELEHALAEATGEDNDEAS